MNAIGFGVLYLYMAVLLIRPQEFVSWLYGAPILFFIEIVLILVWLGCRKSFRAPQYVDIAALSFSVFASLLLVSFTEAYQALIDFIVYSVVIFLCVAQLVKTVEQEQKLLRLMVLCTLIMSLHGYDQMTSPNYTAWTGKQALARNDAGDDLLYQITYLGFFEDPNDLGMILNFSVPIIVYFAFQARKLVRWGYWLPVLLIHLYAIYLTNSRGTLLALVATAGLYGLYRYGGVRAVFLAALAVPVLAALAPSRSGVSGDSSSMERIEAWYEGIKMFQWRPIFGVGKGQFLEHHYKTAHNSWVLAFAELGLVGYFFWFSLIGHSLYYVWRIYRYAEKKVADIKDAALEARYLAEKNLNQALFFSMFASLLSAFFISRSYMVLIYIMTGLAVAHYHRMTELDSGFVIRPMRSVMFLASIGVMLAIYILILIML